MVQNEYSGQKYCNSAVKCLEQHNMSREHITALNVVRGFSLEVVCTLPLFLLYILVTKMIVIAASVVASTRTVRDK